MDADLTRLSAQVGRGLTGRGWKLATAESCTGGWIAAVVTATAGSSDWFERGFVTYSNESKLELLGVTPGTLDSQGAVSTGTVAEMARGALGASRADVALAVSGIAGPGGGTPDKPVGTVCFAWCARDATARVETLRLSGDRDAVRRAAVIHALEGLMALLAQDP